MMILLVKGMRANILYSFADLYGLHRTLFQLKNNTAGDSQTTGTYVDSYPQGEAMQTALGEETEVG